MVLIIVLYALFGASFPVSKGLLAYISPTLLVGCRMTLAGLILLSYQYLHPKEKFHFKKEHIVWYAQIIFFGVYLTYMLRFWALNYLTASKTSFLFNLSPFMSSYYSHIFFKERMTKKQWIGLGIGFLGLIPIFITTSAYEVSVGEFAYISWPELAIVLAVAAQSYSWIIMRKLVKENSYSPMMVNGITMTAGGVIGLITAFLFETMPVIENVQKFSLLLASIIIISNIICHNLYGFLLKQYTATFISFAGFLGPIFTAFYGWLFLGESITWHYYLSGIIVFVGLWTFYQEEILKDLPFLPTTQADLTEKSD